VTTFDLADKLSTKAKKLSGGWQQLVAIASAFATGPRAVVLDEATSSLDQGLKERVPEFFNYIAQEYGTTIVMVTHDVDNIVAPRIIEMDQGKIVSDIVRNPKHR
jgi:energy-coupling factor transporter ATP-binding protein EcfA2